MTSSQMIQTKLFKSLARDYAGYNHFDAFTDGAHAYLGRLSNPYGDTYKGQAFDRGMECAMRYVREMSHQTFAA